MVEEWKVEMSPEAFWERFGIYAGPEVETQCCSVGAVAISANLKYPTGIYN
jgi:hypothetical protein